MSPFPSKVVISQWTVGARQIAFQILELRSYVTLGFYLCILFYKIWILPSTLEVILKMKQGKLLKGFAYSRYSVDWSYKFRNSKYHFGIPWWLSSKESTCNAGGAGAASSILGSRWSPGGRNGYPLQYSCPDNPMDRGAWRAIVHRFAKSWTWLKQLSMHACKYHLLCSFMMEESLCLSPFWNWQDMRKGPVPCHILASDKP